MPVTHTTPHDQFDPSNEAMLHAENDETLSIIDRYYAGELTESEMYDEIAALEESHMYDSLMGEF